MSLSCSILPSATVYRQAKVTTTYPGQEIIRKFNPVPIEIYINGLT